MSRKSRIAILGYGNIGKYALQAIESSPDMELAGIVRRSSSLNQATPSELTGVKLVSSIDQLEQVDVAVLAAPTNSVAEQAKQVLAQGIRTVDSFDIHYKIVDYRNELDAIAKKHQSAAIIAAGWDPGTDSMIRSIFEFMAPKGITYTNFGPGMSMGHSVAVRTINGVKDALSITIPLGTGVHRRLVYVEIADNASFDSVKTAILNDPYFVRDETHVIQVSDVSQLLDMGHGVSMERKGVSGTTQNQLLHYDMRINNPALTGQVLIASARAVLKQQPGAYTMIEVPIIDYIYGDRDELIHKLV